MKICCGGDYHEGRFEFYLGIEHVLQPVFSTFWMVVMSLETKKDDWAVPIPILQPILNVISELSRKVSTFDFGGDPIKE